MWHHILRVFINLSFCLVVNVTGIPYIRRTVRPKQCSWRQNCVLTILYYFCRYNISCFNCMSICNTVLKDRTLKYALPNTVLSHRVHWVVAVWRTVAHGHCISLLISPWCQQNSHTLRTKYKQLFSQPFRSIWYILSPI